MIDLSVKRVANILVTVVAVSVLAVFVIQAVPGVIGAEASYVVLSGSMEPTISTGDAVVVNAVDPATIDRGDIITYTRGAEAIPVTHRVVNIRNGDSGLVFETKGDANEDADPEPIGADQVTGEVWFVIPFIGHVILFANTTVGLGVLVGLPIVAFLLSELYVFARGGATTREISASASTDGDAQGESPEIRSEASTDEGAVRENQVAVGDVHSTGKTDTEGFVLTEMDLKISSIGFGLLAGYSGFVIYQHPGPIHAAVFVAAVLILTFLAIVLAQGMGWVGWSESESTTQSTDETASETLADGGSGTAAESRGEKNGE